MLFALVLAVLAQADFRVERGFTVHPAPPPAPAAVPNRETNAGKPAAVRIGDATPRKVPAPAANFTVRDSKGNVIIANGYEPGPEPPDDRQWVTDTAHPGWQGFGRINAAGWLVDVTEWRTVATAPPATFGPTWPALTRPMPPRIEWRPPAAYFAPPVLGGCAGGQCAAPGYYRQRGFFGFR